eukprot:gene1456-4615_t
MTTSPLQLHSRSRIGNKHFQQYILALVTITQLLLFTLAHAQSNSATCAHPVQNCDSNRDYFDTKLHFDYASSVRNISFHNTYIKLDMSWTAWSGFHQVHYIFIRCGCPSPNIAGYKEFHVPVNSAFLEETVVVPRIHLIGQRSRLVAVASSAFITTQTILDDIANEVVLDIQNNYTRLFELDKLPDVLITGTRDNSQREGWTTHMEDRQFLDADPGETTPLGRAELVKLTGYLFGAEDAAQAIFDLVEFRYLDAKERASTARKRPTVMLGVPFPNWGWTMSAGSTYVGQFLRDANVEYLNDDGNFPRGMSSATVLENFSESQFWINALYRQPGHQPMTMDALVSGNQSQWPTGDRGIFLQFRAAKCGNVYSNDAAIQPPLQGNPYWEEGVLRPDIILSDLVAIFHSELFPNTRLRYYQRLTPLSDPSDLGPCNAVDLALRPQEGKNFLWTTYDVIGHSRWHFLDRVFTQYKQDVAQHLNIPWDHFQMFISNNPPPSLEEDKWTLEVMVKADDCGNCGFDGPETVSQSCVELASRVDDLRELLEADFQQTDPSSVVSHNDGVHVMCADGNVALSTLLPGKSSSKGLSRGDIVGIVVGCVMAVMLTVFAAIFSYRSGHAHAYKKLTKANAETL